MLRFSANLGFLWRDLDLLARIEAAADAGFKAIELHWPYSTEARQVREKCEEHGIELLGLNTHVGERQGDFGLGALPGREKEFQASFDTSLSYAKEAGATAIHVMAGLSGAAGRKQCAETLRRNLQYAAQRTDLTLLLEPINQRDRPGYFYSTLSDAAEIATDVGAANIKLMFDVYHIAISEGDVTRKLQQFLPAIGHIQIAAVPSRAEPDEGEIDYRHILTTVDLSAYEGWVGCEYIPRTDTDHGLRWMETLLPATFKKTNDRRGH